MFKPGDKVVLKDGCSINDFWPKAPKILDVLSVLPDFNFITFVNCPNNGKGTGPNQEFTFFANKFKAYIHEKPPENIEHEGYIYTRGEKIAPSWLKDGEWLIHEFDGGVRQVRQKSEGVYDIIVTEDVGVRYHEGIKNQYRKFKQEDWKWGMYCEFQGEVWVLSYMPKSLECGKQPVYIGNGDKFTATYLCEITPTFKR